MRWLNSILFLVLIVGTLEVASRRGQIFKKVLYSNNHHLDYKLEFLREGGWQMLALGSSEVHWGFDPDSFEKEILASQNTAPKTFNLGIDGFTLSIYRYLLEGLNFGKGPLKEVKWVLIGLNLTEVATLMPANADEGFSCQRMGVLQVPVFLSSFGWDQELVKLCQKSSISNLSWQQIAKISALFRYRSSWRDYVFHTNLRNLDLADLHMTERGWFFRKGMTALEMNAEFEHYLKERPTSPHTFQPEAETQLRAQVADGGFYDYWVGFFKSRGIVPIFYALPTNPRMIEIQGRQDNYRFMTNLMKDWAKTRHVIYVDLGLDHGFDANKDYADRRHLSETGAVKFSKKLAQALKSHIK